ncbi:hypothetical protein [Neisseria sp. CCUG12390]|uniref:hypothetical protein n=1 Tax=Neisseria sp. CCUG12390 TaxID=3392035 RepID=UPI003A0FCCBF
MSDNTQNWFFKKFTGKRLLLHCATALLLAALSFRQLMVADSLMNPVLILVTAFYFRYAYQYWKGWDSSQGQRQYIRLLRDEMEYFVAPAGRGRLKYDQIRYMYVFVEDNYHNKNGHLIIEYRLPEDDEDSPDLHELEFNLDFLIPPKDSGKLHTAIPDLNIMHTAAFEAALRSRCRRLYSLIQREGLRDREWLEAEKEKTRKWLDGFKQ